MNPVMHDLPRSQRRILLRQERKLRNSGAWGTWETVAVPRGAGHPDGWLREVCFAKKNAVFSVLVRNLPSGVIHMAVSSLSGKRPTWHEMQRIKNELAGPERTAVEVYPPADEVVDGADMFHIWVLPNGLPFSLWHSSAR